MEKQEKAKIKVSTEKRRVYTMLCPHCHKKIRGGSPSASWANLQTHMIYCLDNPNKLKYKEYA